jgi:hypothetical protein
MSLKINQTITTKDGFSVPSGSIVRFNTIFTEGSYDVHYNMNFYRSQEGIDSGDQPYRPLEMSSLGYVKSHTFESYTALTITQVHIDLRDYLSTIYTGGTIDIVI